MGFWLKQIKREFDTKPIACHVYVTDQCNLDCSYCTEYDNSVPHPRLTDLKAWLRKIKELGCIRVGLQGGEPLLHPDIVSIVRYCKALDFNTSMSTNGFMLTPRLIQDLQTAGLDSLQVSVDRMTPIPATRKSLKTLMPKLALLKKSQLPFSLSGVLFQDTLGEARAMLDYGLSQGIPTHFRLVHAGPNGHFGVDPGEKEALQSLLDLQRQEKTHGSKIHTSWHLLHYQHALLNGEKIEWTCVAGYKYFFVSSQGRFWLCSSNHQPNIALMDVTPELLRSYLYKKDCQEGCGVYCIISESLVNNNPVKFGMSEAWEHLQAKSTQLFA
jgi:MoaA/NifB/PqqE/SkfB family radical SAM enzyme